MSAPPTRFQPAAAARLRAEIRAAGGVEVMAIGTLDEAGLVAEVVVHCRGTADQVLVMMLRPVAGQVVIHNHPSGLLLPSEADLNIAGQLGQDGVGSVIVNNDLSAANWIVEPHRRRPVEVPAGDVAHFFAHALPRVMEGHEARGGQAALAERVRAALSHDQIVTLEAGTGTGKSLAYLVPAALWARANQGKVCVATYTLTLQNQLATSDLPVLGRAGVEIRSAVVKGRNNYLCRRRLAEALGEAELAEDDRRALEGVARFAETATEGTRQDLGVPLDDQLWERIESDHDQTLRARCPHFDRCFYYEARRRAADAHVLVVNHSLMLADRLVKAETGGEGVLPAYDRLVLDEAHHLEDAATSLLQAQLTEAALRRAIAPLLPRRRRPGAVERLQARFLAKGSPLHPDDQARFAPAAETLLRMLPVVLETTSSTLSMIDSLGNPTGLEALRVDPAMEASPEWTTAIAPGLHELRQLLGQTNKLIEQLNDLLAELPPAQRLAEPQPVFDLGRAGRRIAERARFCADFVAGGTEHVRWIGRQRGRSGRAPLLSIAPIEVGEQLRQHVFSPLKTTVLTSATLTVNGSFEHFLGRVGLDPARRGLGAAEGDPEEDAPTERGPGAAPAPAALGAFDGHPLLGAIFPSPFDYRRQALLGLPRDAPQPDHPDWIDYAGRATAAALHVARGGAFVLCTSHEAVAQLHARAQAVLGDRFLLLRQGEMGKNRLLQVFKDNGNAVLFGTDSFWEGVSVRGAALRLVVIPKLPFRVPTEPVQQARYERIEAQGLDPFRTFTLPSAVLRLRQGFGRLVRAADDRGAVLILDRRVHDRWYGRVFLRSLPDMERAVGPTRAVLERLRDFYRAAPTAPPGRPVP